MGIYFNCFLVGFVYYLFDIALKLLCLRKLLVVSLFYSGLVITLPLIFHVKIGSTDFMSRCWLEGGCLEAILRGKELDFPWGTIVERVQSHSIDIPFYRAIIKVAVFALCICNIKGTCRALLVVNRWSIKSLIHCRWCDISITRHAYSDLHELILVKGLLIFVYCHSQWGLADKFGLSLL